MDFRRIAALISGPFAFLVFALFPGLGGMTDPARYTAGITAWMALWWITEVTPVAVTALLPLVLFPLCGVAPLKSISGEFGNEIIFLFLSGFFFGQTIERWGLHRRIALRMVYLLGNRPSRTVLGFMLATGFISMWISNTATAVMMTPVAIAVASNTHTGVPNGHFGKALMLGVAYACSIGGLATIMGTPTNAIFIGFVQQKMNFQVSFWTWFLFAFPFALLLLLVCWWMLIKLFPLGAGPGRNDTTTKDVVREELRALGPVSVPEKRLMLVFGAVILAWVTGSLFWYKHIPNSNDTVVAVCGALALFLWPAGMQNTTLLDWSTAVRIPWGVILFFGGGLALAKGFDQSGLATWMGSKLEALQALPQVLVLAGVLVVVVVLSEIASNIATASMMMPVLAALAVSVGIEPMGMLISAAMAASFGFGLPVATAPNTIAFGSGYLRTRDMARAGFLLDLVAILLLLAFVYTLLPAVWGIRW
jgi:sodium-dependent dicarboxylate transporter 2/3/5